MKLVELFHSVQGEGRYTGYPMTFIRITGCPVGCPFCDTDYEKGTPWKIEEIVANVKHVHICITGGEPLVNPQIEDLLAALLRIPLLHKIHIETSGVYSPPGIFYQYRGYFWLTISPKGSFLNAKKDFNPNLLYDADEVKWVYPSTPRSLIEDNMAKCGHTYIQPLNETLEINYENVEKARKLAAELDLPLSIQMHKIFNWR
jgi:7-carboxy-7-deazaguanine synthase